MRSLFKSPVNQQSVLINDVKDDVTRNNSLNRLSYRAGALSFYTETVICKRPSIHHR